MTNPTKDKVSQAEDAFWESIPSIWHYVRAHIHEEVVANPIDITVGQFHILRQIRKGTNSVSALAESRWISKPAISRKVDALVNKGLVSRVPNPEDRRNLELSLTDDGDHLLSSIFDETHRWMKNQLGSLSNTELETIHQGLQALKKAFFPDR